MYILFNKHNNILTLFFIIYLYANICTSIIFAIYITKLNSYLQ